MDGLGMETNAFLTWFSQWGSVIYVIVNMVYWVVVAVAAVFAAVQAKRLVDFKLGIAPKSADAGDTGAVSVEEFVD